MPEDIEKFKNRIGYTFVNRALLREALTHRSYAVENHLAYDNQRLEFLGDAVLEIVLTERLFHLYPQYNEGIMTKMRSALVQQDALAHIARKLEFGNFLITGRGELESGGTERDSTLADLFEAVLGAFYLDAGFDAVKNFILTQFHNEYPEPHRLLTGLNPKGILQEYSQRRWNTAPQYQILQITGPEHNPSFEVQVTIGGITASGAAHNRRQAESQAARHALMRIREQDPSIEEFELSQLEKSAKNA